MNSKKGISLVVLTITIIITIIIAGISIIGIGNSIERAKLTAFAKELNDICQRVQVYYYENGELPYLDTDVAMSQGELLQMLDNVSREGLLAELEKNNDKVESDELGAFYKIDLSKIDVKEISRGTQKTANDIFVMAYPSFKIYYLKGIEVGGDFYYSITPEMSKITKISEIPLEELGNSVINGLPGITITKNNKKWTNSFGIKVSGYINSGDELYLSLPTSGEKKINLTTDSFANFEAIDLYTLKNQGLVTITDAEILEFLNLPNKDKKITFIKKENSVSVGSVDIDLSNYDYIKPLISNDEVSMSLSDDIVSCNFKVSDDLSGVNEVRYYPITNQNIDISMYTEQFVKARGKKATLDLDNNASFEISTDVRKVMIAVVDKAGNINLYSRVNTYYSPFIFNVSQESGNTVSLDRDLIAGIVYTIKNYDQDFYMSNDLEYTISISNPDGTIVDNLDLQVDGVIASNDSVTKIIQGGSAKETRLEMRLVVPDGKKLYNSQSIKIKFTPTAKPKLSKEFNIKVENHLLVDYSGNSLDGILRNGIQVVKDEEGLYALQFDGIDDYVEIPEISSSLVAADGIRIEFVATWEAYNNNSRVISLSAGENNGTIFVKNNSTTGQLYFRTNTSSNKNLDLYSKSNSAIVVGKKSKYYSKWVYGGKGEGGIALWWRGDFEIDDTAIDRRGTALMYTSNPISTIARNTNYLGKSDNSSDEYFKGKIYSIKVMKSDYTVIFEYDLNK